MFKIEEHASDSAFVDRIWYAQTESTGAFFSQAAIRCELVVIKYNGKTTVVLRGPETKATTLPVRWIGAEFFGITFKTGTFIPTLPPKTLLNGKDITLSHTSNQTFWLDSSTWQIPDHENADTFVDRLVRENILVSDPVVEAVLQGHEPDMSTRSIQYRFLQATGLTQKTIEQIQRAHQAAHLLEQGMSIVDAVHAVGYYDQSHMTNSLKRFLGETPAQIQTTEDLVKRQQALKRFLDQTSAPTMDAITHG